MTNGLPSVNAKLNRGDEHFKRLNAEIAAWKDRAPWTIKSERDDDSRRFVVGICFDEYLDLLHWGLLLGEVLYNYRCALDHQAYLLACRHTGKSPPPKYRQLAFPICSTRENFAKARSRNLVGLKEGAQQVIEGVQPYQCDDPACHPLTRLRELNDIDKHRVLHIAVFNLRRVDAEVSGLPKEQVKVSFNAAALEREDWLFGFEYPQPSDGPAIDDKVSIRIALADEPAPRKALLEVLSDIRQEVLGVVSSLRPFEVEVDEGT